MSFSRYSVAAEITTVNAATSVVNPIKPSGNPNPNLCLAEGFCWCPCSFSLGTLEFDESVTETSSTVLEIQLQPMVQQEHFILHNQLIKIICCHKYHITSDSLALLRWCSLPLIYAFHFNPKLAGLPRMDDNARLTGGEYTYRVQGPWIISSTRSWYFWNRREPPKSPSTLSLSHHLVLCSSFWSCGRDDLLWRSMDRKSQVSLAPRCIHGKHRTTQIKAFKDSRRTCHNAQVSFTCQLGLNQSIWMIDVKMRKHYQKATWKTPYKSKWADRFRRQGPCPDSRVFNCW